MKQAIKKFVGAAIAMLAIGSTATAAVEVCLRERVVLKSSVVRLADVAEVASDGADGERSLTALPLMPAPAPGTQRFLQRREVADLLAAHGVDLQNVQFQGADQVAITAEGESWNPTGAETGTAISALGSGMNRHAAVLAGHVGKVSAPSVAAERATEMNEALSRAIAGYLETKPTQAAKWRVHCELADRQLAQLEAATTKPVVQGGSVPWTGRQRFIVAFGTPEGQVHLPVYAEVSVESKPLVVAVQPISRGEVFTAAHLEVRPVDFVPQATERRSAVESVEALIGMEARQAIQAGNVVFSDQVQAPMLIKRGEVITISSHAGGIRVRTTARSRQDGAKGDIVQVESLETRERFDARVVGPREAAVFAVARPAEAEPTERIGIARRPLR